MTDLKREIANANKESEATRADLLKLQKDVTDLTTENSGLRRTVKRYREMVMEVEMERKRSMLEDRAGGASIEQPETPTNKLSRSVSSAFSQSKVLEERDSITGTGSLNPRAAYYPQRKDTELVSI